MATPSTTLFDVSGKGLKLDTAQDVATMVSDLNAMPEVTEVRLSGNTFGVEAIRAIAQALDGKKELKICQFSDIFIGRLKTEIPDSLRLLTAPLLALPIHTLDLSDNALGPAGAEPLVPFLSQTRTLHTLVLNNNGLGVGGGTCVARALLAHASHPARGPLRHLSCGRNRLESGTMRVLGAALAAHPHLAHLAIPQNGVRPDGWAALVRGLRACPRLAHLDLQDNTLTARGARALAAGLPAWPRLATLHLGDCLLTDRGGVRVLAALAGPLTHLHLAYNELARPALGALAGYVRAHGHRLEGLEINGNCAPADSDAVRAIRDALRAHGREHVLDELDEMDEDDETSGVEEDDEEEEDEEEEDEEEKEEKEEEKEAAKKADTEALERALEKLSVNP